MSEIDIADFLKKEAARNQRLAGDADTKNRRRTLAYRATNHQRALAEIERLTAERDEAMRQAEANTELAGLLRDELSAVSAEVERLRDELADSNDAMLRRFDPPAADSTDLYTWISCKLAELARVSGSRET